MDEFLEKFNDTSEQELFGEDMRTFQLHASLPYLCPIFFFIPVVFNKESSFCRFHSNQMIAWLICCVIISIVVGILDFIPILGALVGFLCKLAMLIISCVLCYASYKGFAVRIPIIGEKISFF